MSIDRNILHALSRRDRFKALKSSVPTELIDGNTATMLQWYELYFSTHTDHTTIQWDALLTLIQLRSNAGPDVMAVMRHLVGVLQQGCDPTALKNTVNTLEELNLAGTSAALISRFNAGEEVDLSYELRQLAHDSRQRMERSGDSGWADGDPLEYLKQVTDEGGLQWTTFPILQQNLKGVRPADNIAICAPTDKGKTSLLMRVLADFAKQAVTEYPDRPALYLVNEGWAENLTPRFYQTALNASIPELMALGAEGLLLDKYCRVVGRRDHVRFVNVHGMNVAQVNRIIEAHEPYLVISDMTGRIRSNTNKTGGMNDIGQLEDVWNCMREMAAMQQFIHIGTVQVSAEGFDQLYPPLSALQNSKTGIQTTFDLCLMMGAIEADNCQNLRGISTPKNKRARTGKPSLNKLETTFQPERNVWLS